MYSIIPQDVRAGIANPGRLEQQFMEMLRAANLNFDNSKTIAVVDFFDSKNFNAISNAEFFDGNSSATAGETNVNSTVRPQSEHALIYGMKILTANEDPVFAQNELQDGLVNMPAPLQNGVFQVQVNGVNQTAKIPLRRVSDTSVNQGGGANAGMFYFDVPWFWPGQQDLKIRMSTAGNLVTPVGDSWVEVQIFGIGLIS